MDRLPRLAVASLVISVVVGSAGLAYADEPIQAYWDVASAQAVGSFSGRDYTLNFTPSTSDGSGVTSFVGKQHFSGTFVGGMTPVMMWDYVIGKPRGIRVSLGIDGAVGAMMGLPAGIVAQDPAILFEGQISVGYRYTLGRWTLHSSTVLRGDYLSFNAAAPSGTASALSAASAEAAASSAGGTYAISSLAGHVGQEIGARVELLPRTSLFARGEMDVDGQWMVTGGIGFRL